MSKKCLNCDKVLEEVCELCPDCGQSNFEPIVESSEVADPQTVEAVVAETDVLDTESVETESLEPVETPVQDAPKKKKKWWKIAIFTVVPLALVLAIIFNLSNIITVSLKTFASPEQYYRYIEKKNIENEAEEFAEAYDEFLDVLSNGGNSAGKMSFVVGKDLQTILKSSLGTEMDLDWLNNISLSIDASTKDDKQSANLGLLIDNKNILSLKTIVDFAAEKSYISVPELSEKVIKITTEMDNNVNATTINNIAPDADVVEKLIVEYLEVIVDNIDEVEKSQETVELEGIKQNLTVLEYNIDQAKMRQIGILILEKIKSDADIKAIIEKAEQELDKDIYDSFVDSVDEELDNLKNAESDDNKVLKVKNYVDSKNDIVGRVIEFDDNTVIEYIEIRDGYDIASKVILDEGLELEEEVVVIGLGSVKKNMWSCEYTVTVDGETISTIQVADLDVKKAKNGDISCTLTIVPDEDFLKKSIDPDTAILLSLTDLTIQIKLEASDDSSKVSAVLLNNGKDFFGIVVDSASKKAENITVPSENVIDSDNDTAMSEFLVDMDLEGIIAKLKDTSVPDDLVDMLEMMITGGYYGNSSSDDYFYDNDYVYY